MSLTPTIGDGRIKPLSFNSQQKKKGERSKATHRVWKNLFKIYGIWNIPSVAPLTGKMFGREIGIGKKRASCGLFGIRWWLCKLNSSIQISYACAAR